jgi:hypothetical protein
VDEVAGFFDFFHFLLLIIILLLFHAHVLPPLDVCDSPAQAVHYYTVDHKLETSSVNLHLAAQGGRAFAYAFYKFGQCFYFVCANTHPHGDEY